MGGRRAAEQRARRGRGHISGAGRKPLVQAGRRLGRQRSARERGARFRHFRGVCIGIRTAPVPDRDRAGRHGCVQPRDRSGLGATGRRVGIQGRFDRAARAAGSGYRSLERRPSAHGGRWDGRRHMAAEYRCLVSQGRWRMGSAVRHHRTLRYASDSHRRRRAAAATGHVHAARRKRGTWHSPQGRSASTSCKRAVGSRSPI